MEALVSAWFSNLSAGDFEKRVPKVQFTRQSLVKTKPIEQMHLAIAYKALPRGSEKEEVVTALNSILGGSMSARLFQEVREKRGLAYSVYSYNSCYQECGSINVYAGVNAEHLQDAYGAITDVITDMKKNGITEDEFSRSREQMKASMLFSGESTNTQMLLYGKSLLYYNEVFDFDKKLEKINTITRGQAMEVLAQLFDENQKALAVVGNTDKPLSF